jgi:hypothetical protein
VSFTMAFALQLRKKHGKTSVSVATHTHTHPHITKQFKTIRVQIKTNAVQDIPKWNSHNIIKFPQDLLLLLQEPTNED